MKTQNPDKKVQLNLRWGAMEVADTAGSEYDLELTNRAFLSTRMNETNIQHIAGGTLNIQVFYENL